MSWTDESRCLFCDGKLPLYRKLSQGQFCSKAHQDAYWKEQEKLAVETLHRTHDALQAYKPTVSIESILGPAPVAEPQAPKFVDTDPPFAGLLTQTSRLAATQMRFASVLVADPVEYEMLTPISAPALSAEYLQTEIADEPEPQEAEAADPPESGLLALPAYEAQAAAPSVQPVELESAPELLLLPAPALPLLEVATHQEWAAVDAVSWDAVEPATFDTVADSSAAIGFRGASPLLPELEAVPCDEALERAEDLAIPMAAGLLPLPDPGRAGIAAAIAGPEPTEEAFAATVPLWDLAAAVQETELAPAEVSALFALDLEPSLDAQPKASASDLEPLEFSQDQPELAQLSLTPAGSDPAMAGLSPLPAPETRRQNVVLRSSTDAVSFEGTLAHPSLAVAIPEVGIRTQATGLQRIEARDRMQFRPGSYKARGPVVSAPVEREVELPRLRVEADHRTSLLAQAEHAGSYTHLLTGVRNFWQQAPRDLKILLFAVPLAIGLAFHPSLPKVSVQSPQAGVAEVKDAPGFFQRVVSTQMANVKKAIADRAAIGLDENFRQGLDNWMSNSGSTAEWTFDQAGFVLPGRVALYQPSLGLKDYELQFLGAIDKGSLSWVVRAADFQNYYVVKLAVIKPGVIPQLGIIRYSVINGKPVDRVDTPVALNTRTDSLYRVRMEMQGDHFSLSVQGQVIDAWTEARLRHGGVGFFTNRGEQSRIGWVQVTHQYDTLGRLFAYLAP